MSDNTNNTKRLAMRGLDSTVGDQDGDEDVEIVWHVQGVLMSLEMPPFVPKGK